MPFTMIYCFEVTTKLRLAKQDRFLFSLCTDNLAFIVGVYNQEKAPVTFDGSHIFIY